MLDVMCSFRNSCRAELGGRMTATTSVSVEGAATDFASQPREVGPNRHSCARKK